MDSEIEKIKILRLTEESRESIEDVVVRESPITIILNNEELVTMLCSPKNLDFLAVGFLFSEGLLERKEEIKNVLVDETRACDAPGRSSHEADSLSTGNGPHNSCRHGRRRSRRGRDAR